MWQNWRFAPIFGKGSAVADLGDEILTLEEVTVYLKAGKRTVYRLTQQGTIPVVKLSANRHFRRAELDRWIAANIEKNQNEVNDDAVFYHPASGAAGYRGAPCHDSLI
jgi:excisionase family DNA binding protein